MARLPKAWSQVDGLERFVSSVEDELRRLGHIYRGREAASHTLQPAALINEAYMRLLDRNVVEWQGRAHSSRSLTRVKF